MQFIAKDRPPRTTRCYDKVTNMNMTHFEKAFEDALTDLYTDTYYGVFMDKYPIKWGDDLTPQVKDHFANEDTFACTDGDVIYVDIESLYTWLKLHVEDGSGSVLDEIKAVVAHEITHIVCEHARYMKKVAEQYEDKLTHRIMMPSVVYNAHKITQEIQANRGVEVRHYTAIYNNGVTEDAFPVTKGKVTYHDIFSALMSQAKSNANAMAEAVAKLKDSLTSDSEARGGAKDKKTGKDSSDGGNGSENGSTDESKGKGKSGHDEKVMTQDEIEDAIKKAAEAEARLVSELQHKGGGGGLDPFLIANHNDTAPQDSIKPAYEAWHEEKLKKEIKRLHGYIRGNLTRVKGATYSRPSLRRTGSTLSSGLIAKGRKYLPNATPKVLVAMDNSGSMSGTSVTSVGKAIGLAYKDLGRPTTGCYICTHEDSVHSVNNLKNWQKVVDNFSPTGGNCFNNVVKKANELGCNVVFNIGDGLDCVSADYDKGSSQGRAVAEFLSRGGVWIDILVTGTGRGANLDGYRARDEAEGLTRVIVDLL